MATGTGKTYTAFQIIWRLWKADGKSGSSFSPIAISSLTRRGSRTSPRSASACEDHQSRGRKETTRFTCVSTRRSQVRRNSRQIYRQFPPISLNSSWSTSATAAARLTTPPGMKFSTTSAARRNRAHRDTQRDDRNLETPITSASRSTHIRLKQGIEDGFLAPYKVYRIGLDKDSPGLPAREGQDRQTRPS